MLICKCQNLKRTLAPDSSSRNDLAFTLNSSSRLLSADSLGLLDFSKPHFLSLSFRNSNSDSETEAEKVARDEREVKKVGDAGPIFWDVEPLSNSRLTSLPVKQTERPRILSWIGGSNLPSWFLSQRCRVLRPALSFPKEGTIEKKKIQQIKKKKKKEWLRF